MTATAQFSRRPFVERVVAAALLRRAVFAEVAEDRAANGQAFLVVALTGLFNGLGLVRRLGPWGVSAGIGAAVLGWLLWTAVIFVVGLAFRQGRPGHGSLLRALAFANAPSILLVFGVVPVLGPLVRVLVVVWLVATTAVAAQAVYDMSRWRSAILALVGFLVYLVLGVELAYVLD
jgi:hypothetical protein